MASAQLGDALRQIHRLYNEGTVAGLADAQLLERFLDHRDEAAFTALVERHGPMVLGTCRAVLKDPHHAEDAFQASFLLLVRKARSIRGRDSLGGWLHRVARRVAVEANAQAVRRRIKESEAGSIAAAQFKTNQGWDDLHSALHAEVDRLPEQYRLPVVLCDLEGLSRDEAASRLSWTLGTVRGRLARARRLLRSRLTRRGLAPATVLLGGAAARGAVPAAWVAATVRSAVGFATTPSTAATLGAATLRTLSLTKLKAVAATILATATLFALEPAGKLATRGEPNVQTNETNVQGHPPGRAEQTPPPPVQPASIVIRGRVLGPDGHARAGARLFLFGRALYGRGRTNGLRPEPTLRAVSDADGRFRFEIPKAEFDTNFRTEPWNDANVIAVADGFGLAHAQGPSGDEELTLRLVADDVPILGRVIDLQGQPVAGASVRVQAVKTTAGDDLSGWLDALRARRSAFDVEGDFFPRPWYRPEASPIVPPVVTGADGRFRIEGIGRERLATLLIEGPAIESAQLNVMTRPEETIRVPSYRSPGVKADVTYVGARFEHVAGPSRPIEGTVRDKVTGQPLAGIIIRGEEPIGGNPIHDIQTTTGEQGRYRLVGLPKGREGKILAMPAADQPFLRSLQGVGGQDESDRVRLDIALTRGVRVSGRITNKRTGRPIKANLDYFVFVDNPHLKDAAGFRWALDRGTPTDEDGDFELIALPGPGVVAARGQEDRYLMGVGADTLPDDDGNGILDTHPYGAIPTNYHAIAKVDPAPDAESLTCNLVLDPGRDLSGTVLDPDGNPLPGALISGLYDMEYWEHKPLATAQFTLTGLRPGKPRLLQLIHPEKKLAGWLMVPADETDTPVVKLDAWGSATGRLVDDDGLPRTDVRLFFGNPDKRGPRQGHLRGNGSGMSGRMVPDSNGRFRMEGLAPGLRYSLRVEGPAGRLGSWVVRDLTVKPGETRDLGDVRAIASETKDPN